MHLNWNYVFVALSSATGLSALSYALESFPVPSNVYAKWFIGVLLFIVGKKNQAQQTISSDTVTGSLPTTVMAPDKQTQISLVKTALNAQDQASKG